MEHESLLDAVSFELVLLVEGVSLVADKTSLRIRRGDRPNTGVADKRQPREAPDPARATAARAERHALSRERGPEGRVAHFEAAVDRLNLVNGQGRGALGRDGRDADLGVGSGRRWGDEDRQQGGGNPNDHARDGLMASHRQHPPAIPNLVVKWPEHTPGGQGVNTSPLPGPDLESSGESS